MNLKNNKQAIKVDLLMVVLVFLLTLVLIFTSSCKHEPRILPKTPEQTGDNGNGNGNQQSTCNPDSVYFQNTILPLIVSSCAKSGCHDAISHKDGIVLDSYQNIMNHGDIRSGRPGNSDLYEVITETDPDDIMPPPPFAPLSQTDIDLIASWINQGALNNSCSEGGSCDTSIVRFAANINPLLQSKCVGCHNNTLSSGNVNLSSFANVSVQAQNGKLLGAITHSSSFVAMPPAGNQLSACEIATVRTWIREGALNN